MDELSWLFLHLNATFPLMKKRFLYAAGVESHGLYIALYTVRINKEKQWEW